MIRITTATLLFGLFVMTSGHAATVTETLNGFVSDVDGAVGLAPGDPVTTFVSFDDTMPVFPGTFMVSTLSITLPGNVVLTQADDALGILEVGFDGERVTSLFSTLTINEPAFGFAGGALTFEAFGDGSLAFFLFDGASVVAEGSVVPLPAALPLLATGLVGLGWLRRRRRAGAI